MNISIFYLARSLSINIKREQEEGEVKSFFIAKISHMIVFYLYPRSHKAQRLTDIRRCT
jgi:hypothetical protein